MDITLDVHPSGQSGPDELLGRTTSARRDSSQDSDLLKAIRSALRGADAFSATPISNIFFNDRKDPPGDEEITWDNETVIVSNGGVIRKVWTFTDERQPVQYACFGMIEESWRMMLSSQYNFSSPNNSHQNSRGDPNQQQRPTFGPFARASMNKKAALDKKYLSLAVFVFLRNIGKVYLRNGIEYTFQLPFIVRKAWPMSPHGILLQRVLEPYEIEEAANSGDEPLPTLFSFTNPFSEASTVGLTKGIIGSLNSALKLVDQDEDHSDSHETIPHSEMIIHTTFKTPVLEFDLTVSVDPSRRTLTIWRYGYVKPKEPHMAAESTPHTQLKPPASEIPSLASLAGSAPSLNTATTMASIMAAASGGGQQGAPPQQPARPRRNSLTRNDLTSNMDNLVLGSGTIEGVPSMDYGRMTPTHWMERLLVHDISSEEAESWRSMTVATFDMRYDGKKLREYLAVCSPISQTLYLFVIHQNPNQTLHAEFLKTVPAIGVASVKSTRNGVRDLVILKPDGRSLNLLMHGLKELPLHLNETHIPTKPADRIITAMTPLTSLSTLQLTYADGYKATISLDFLPQHTITVQALQVCSRFLTSDTQFALHRAFLEEWCKSGKGNETEWPALVKGMEKVFGLNGRSVDGDGEEMDVEASGHSPSTLSDPFTNLINSRSHAKLSIDKAFKKLNLPSSPSSKRPLCRVTLDPPPHPEQGAAMFALHLLAEELRLQLDLWLDELKNVASLVCRLALPIKPEWVDYWKRRLPQLPIPWPTSATAIPDYADKRIPLWPPDFYAILQFKLRESPGLSQSDPPTDHPSISIEKNVNATRLPLWPDLIDLTFSQTASLEYGPCLPLLVFQALFPVYTTLSDPAIPQVKRAELAILNLFKAIPKAEFVNRLPVGLAAPIREAIRTCMVNPPVDFWPPYILALVGRNDLSATATHRPGTDGGLLFTEGYRPPRHFMEEREKNNGIGRPGGLASIDGLIKKARMEGMEVEGVSGVELDEEDEVMKVRFTQDKRLEEAKRLLCSSTVPNVRIVERHDLSELDQAKAYQSAVMGSAERTLALPFGRGMLTFASVTAVTREAYAVPKIEFTIRLQPHSITVAADAGKIAQESVQWGEFHNGVAAALRVSSKTTGIESSWLAFNKPSEMTSQHAGFLFGLGLCGHLKSMMTWHTFGYLTMKQDLTSIGVLLGMAVANVGTGDEHVTKLLAVHTPALLPTPTVDLNVSMMTQAAGLSGIGLLYLGTKNRRMAEVCLTQIRRSDLVQPSLTNEYREAYTNSAALAFGMIMVGKGSDIPADMRLVSRLAALVHGSSMPGDDNKVLFDVNLTSPAATIALGLMYLRTERRDVAEVLTIPDTVLALNRIQPNFLLFRTLARSLIMWNRIQPTHEWLHSNIPGPIRLGLERAAKTQSIPDEGFVLAYYNIISGACFALALKYAGTANESAYHAVIRQFDNFTRGNVTPSASGFDERLKRATIREGLNLVSIALSMIMVGTGEVSILRRLRHAYGNYQHNFPIAPWKYGIHMSMSMAMGLLFLGGGRCALGTSDAAIAAMVTAFFPRWPQASHDNKGFLQALRHLWVLAVEPRCLVARDVDTAEVVLVPINIITKSNESVKLITPTLFPDLDNIAIIRLDTPRYWMFFMDVPNRALPALLRHQTIYVKRKTMYLAYNVDRKGSRGLLARSGSSAGDAAALDFPQVRGTDDPAIEDLSDFLATTTHDIHFLSFADHFCRQEGETDSEKLFMSFCLAILTDCILHDKRTTMQAHLALFSNRTMDVEDESFHLRLHDLAFASFYYGTVYARQFGTAKLRDREPLIRDATAHATLHTLDERLTKLKSRSPHMFPALKQYVTGVPNTLADESLVASKELGWYLVRHGTPNTTILGLLAQLAAQAHRQSYQQPPPDGTDDAVLLHGGIKEVLHLAGNKMSPSLAAGWSVQSLSDILNIWGYTLPTSS